MKLISIKIIVLMSLFVCFSCSLDDIENNGISRGSLIKDEVTAQNYLNGIYSALRDKDGVYMSKYTLALSFYGIYNGTKGYYGISGSAFGLNKISTEKNSDESRFLAKIYSNFYYVIDGTNEMITLLEADVQNKFHIANNRKKELLGEAKAIRAFAHFMLLRTFGEFYDLNSSYGIVIADRVLNHKDFLSRSSVKETYDFILKDLKYATINTPDKKEKRVFITKTTAMALLSKVYLHMNKYTEAASTAKKVIDNATDNYAFASDFETIFSKRWNSKDVLFCSFVNKIEGNMESGNLLNIGKAYFSPSSSFYKIYNPLDKRLKGKYLYDPSDVNTYIFTYYYMRMSEVYLIYAEAEARLGNLSEATSYLNKIRERAGIGTKTFSDKKELLKDIVNQKAVELLLENGEPWFDVVRYDRLGDIVLGTLKPTLAKDPKNPTETSVYKLIFPLPQKAMDGNYKLKQNTGYN